MCIAPKVTGFAPNAFAMRILKRPPPRLTWPIIRIVWSEMAFRSFPFGRYAGLTFVMRVGGSTVLADPAGAPDSEEGGDGGTGGVAVTISGMGAAQVETQCS